MIKKEFSVEPKNNKTIFIVFPPFENEIHNVIYAKELFIDKLLKEGYFVVVVAFCDKHKSLIEKMAQNFRVISFQ